MTTERERIPAEAYDLIEWDLGDCPYYQRQALGVPYPEGWLDRGGCGGCSQEPECVTMRPTEGWPSVVGYTPELLALWRDLGAGDA